MATIHFYEKPGCINNTRQKSLLAEAGHTLIVYNLLQHPWEQQKDKLRSFFGNTPVESWFNLSAPAVKGGKVIPKRLDEQQALTLMMNDPLLIRRPLLEIAGNRFSGFDAEVLAPWLNHSVIPKNIENCPRSQSKDCNP